MVKRQAQKEESAGKLNHYLQAIESAREALRQHVMSIGMPNNVCPPIFVVFRGRVIVCVRVARNCFIVRLSLKELIVVSHSAK